MIIVLKTADFSGNYIEQIQLAVPDHPETDVIAARYTGISAASKTNLNVFIDALINAGIYAKLKYLMIPMLASNIADALQNVLTANKEVIADTGYATLSSKGVTFTNTGFLSLDPVIDAAETDFSYGGAIVSVATPTPSTSERIFTLSSSAQVASQFPRAYMDINSGGTIVNIVKAENDAGATSNFINGINIQSISNGVLSYLSAADTVSTYTLQSTPVITALRLSGTNNSGYHQYLHSSAIRLFFIADNLTDAQMIAFYAAIKTFIEAEA